MMKNRFWTGFWRLADPKISLTSVASIYIGASVAAREAVFSLPWLIVLLVAFFRDRSRQERVGRRIRL